ncbi:sensor histidine kinase [Flavobacterium columnare]|uniref:histidine kinase n=1 Tax=Flavobacterium columnare TaxID=996 RepID=A0AAI8CIH9_9FLAO|nr:HAMP domain-containing sensor histidine kinase [Flavobacterium columnare]AMO21369.2 histidine kinase [Flavobacterium columnare]AUX16896.1 hypothetical protein AQ623_00135 [Flavobacterium columnare]QOG55900.1 PAS domain-containing protein [Flavobacterium columnare]QOG58622.1 PAS domain-containing protein [Flavobacterium columnare]QOG61344.1 PAS domain-containing protein [Flavobacterium columnare]
MQLGLSDHFFLNKIISNQSLLFFQFSINLDGCLIVDYLQGPYYDFFESDIEMFKSEPLLIFRKVVLPIDKSKVLNSIEKSRKNLENLELDFRVVLSKGLKWYKMAVTVEKEKEKEKVSFFGVMTDITDRKKIEEENKIIELRSQFANQASEIGVWDWNLVTNEVFYSAQSLKILEIHEGDLGVISNPEKWDKLVHPDDKEIYFNNIKDHFEGKIPHYETYHRVLCNGVYKWILDRGKVIERDDSGKPLRIIGTHTDVTAQKEKEQKLRETFDVVNNQKGKLMNFAHIVSHNLKSHTENFYMLLSFYKNGYVSTEEVIESLQIVYNELKETIDNLVDLVGVQAEVINEKQKNNLKNYIEKTLSVLKEMIQAKDIVVNLEVDEKIEVSFIPAYLESVILNLTTNAVKYSDPAKKDNFISYYLKSELDDNAEYDVLCVEDNGIGIDLEKYQEAVFGPYKTFHKKRESTGIGLYIAKNQVEAMGGKISVISKLGVGSVFKVYFKR